MAVLDSGPHGVGQGTPVRPEIPFSTKEHQGFALLLRHTDQGFAFILFHKESSFAFIHRRFAGSSGSILPADLRGPFRSR